MTSPKSVCAGGYTQKPISFPEPTCLMVSAKTQSSGISSGIINFQSPRYYDFRFYSACMPWFKTWLPEIKSTWMRFECLCGTNPHRFYLCTSCFKPKHVCAVKPEVLISWTLEIDYSRAPCLGADQKTRGLWDRDCPKASEILQDFLKK